MEQYHRAKPGFPHETTADQWFTESQFESYRALGQHISQKIVGREGSATLDQFVDRASASKCKVLAGVQTLFSS